MNDTERAAITHSRLAGRLYRAWMSLEASLGYIELARDAATGKEKDALRAARDRLRNQVVKLKVHLDQQMEKPPDGETARH